MRLYIDGKYIGNYTEKGDCSIGYKSYTYFKFGAYEVIVGTHDIDFIISNDKGTAVFTKLQGGM